VSAPGSPAGPRGRSSGHQGAGAPGEREARVVLVRGEDPAVVAGELRAEVERLLEDRDRSMVVEEFGGGGEDLSVEELVAGLATAPFLGDRRILVVRGAGRLSTAEGRTVAEQLGSLAEGVWLVLEGTGGTVPEPLVRAIRAAGGRVVERSLRGRAGRDEAWEAVLRRAPVRLDAGARSLLAGHLGEELGRVEGILAAAAAAHGPGRVLGAEDLRGFLGAEGTAQPWALTDALDAGDLPGALAALRRLLGAGQLHPLAVLRTLERWAELLLAVDGAEWTSAEEAAAALGSRSSFPVEKARRTADRLGSAAVGQAVALVAEADVDLKGRSGLPPEVILEVLVARLARLSRRPRARSGGRRSGRRSSA